MLREGKALNKAVSKQNTKIQNRKGKMKNLEAVIKKYLKNVADAAKGTGPIRAAVMAGRKKIYCVLARESGGNVEYFDTLSADIDDDLYNVENGIHDGIEQIRVNIAAFAVKINMEYAVINIVLPDPVSALSVFNPGSHAAMAAKRDILRLKSSGKIGVAQDKISFFMPESKSAVLETDSFAFSSKKVYTETMRGFLHDAQLAPSSSAPGISYIYDAFSEQLSGTKGAIFLVEPEYWTFYLWGSGGRPAYMISRWFEAGIINAAALKDAVSEVERKLRAYSVSNKGVEIDTFYAAGAGRFAAEAAGLIRERFNCGCVELVMPGTGTSEKLNALPVSLIAAAGSR
jgi:hypothetical protein